MKSWWNRYNYKFFNKSTQEYKQERITRKLHGNYFKTEVTTNVLQICYRWFFWLTSHWIAREFTSAVKERMSADQGSKVSAERGAPSGDCVREESAMKTSGREKSREQFDKREESSPAMKRKRKIVE